MHDAREAAGEKHAGLTLVSISIMLSVFRSYHIYYLVIISTTTCNADHSGVLTILKSNMGDSDILRGLTSNQAHSGVG